MGPTKAIMKDGAIYDARTGKLLKDGLTTHEAIRDYVDHHYIVLPVVNKQCEPWLLDGEHIYCLRGTRYENLKDEVLHLARCPDCGGMGGCAHETLGGTDRVPWGARALQRLPVRAPRHSGVSTPSPTEPGENCGLEADVYQAEGLSTRTVTTSVS